MEFNTLVEAVAYWANKTPDKVCLIDADIDRQISYGDFWRCIRIFAGRLKALGVKKGDRVIVRVGPAIETFTAQFAVYLTGGVYCPVEKHMKELRLLEMIDYYDAKHLIANLNLDFDGTLIDIATVCDEGEPLLEYTFPDKEDMCAILFTTGTTGKAKGVMLRHDAVIYAAETFIEIYNFKQNDVYLWTTPLERNSSLKTSVFMFVLGGTSVHFRGFAFIQDFFQALSKYNVSALCSEPLTLSHLLDTSSEYVSNFSDQLRLIFTGGSILPRNYKLQILKLLPNTSLHVIYALTEACPVTDYEFNSHGDKKDNCTGTPVRNTEVKFFDDDGNLIETNVNNPGIIAIKNSRSLTIGYWKAPELTRKTLIDGYLVTTDRGYMDHDGYLHWLGRVDDVIISSGYKIDPYEIEDLVLQIPGIKECVCITAPYKVLGSIIKLFVVMRPGVNFDANIIKDYLSQRVETYKLPRVIEAIGEFPRTPNGSKIDRKALKTYD